MVLLLEPKATFRAVAVLERLNEAVPEAIATFWAVAVLETLSAAMPEAIRILVAIAVVRTCNELPPLANRVCNVPKTSDSNQPWNSRPFLVNSNLELRPCGRLI